MNDFPGDMTMQQSRCERNQTTWIGSISIGLLVMVVGLAMSSLLGGCGVPWYQPGDQLYPGSTHIWTSEEHRPSTVTLFDTRTGDAIWSMEIPPGQWLATKFVDGGGDDDVLRPDRLDYHLFAAGTRMGKLRSGMSVPNAESRRWELTVRDGIEYEEEK